MHLAAGLRPDSLGELERSSRSPSRNWGCLLLRGMKGKRKGKEGDRKGGERGKEKDDLHPTLFLGPGRGFRGTSYSIYRRSY